LESLLQALEEPVTETENKRASGGSLLSTASSSRNTKFRQVMGHFHSNASTAYEKLDKRFKNAQTLYESAVHLFGEDVKTMSPDEFFGIFWNFCVAYNTAKSENELAIQKEEEQRKREAERKVKF
jgi:dishevelled associated activator of morphogenesis